MNVSRLFTIMVIGLAATVSVWANQLQNAGFEIPGQDPEKAHMWEDNATGGMWGNAIRTDWQKNSGDYSAAVRGSWSGNDNGGWWQTCPIDGGKAYELSAQFYYDNGWTAETFELNVEWYKGEEMIGIDKKNITNLPEDRWARKSFRVKAPTDATAAHVVLNIAGIEQEGVLYMDDLALIEQ
jgi:hypothetical protein